MSDRESHPSRLPSKIKPGPGFLSLVHTYEPTPYGRRTDFEKMDGDLRNGYPPAHNCLDVDERQGGLIHALG